LKELLRNRLVECGWRDELKQYCKGWYLSAIEYARQRVVDDQNETGENVQGNWMQNLQ